MRGVIIIIITGSNAMQCNATRLDKTFIRYIQQTRAAATPT